MQVNAIVTFVLCQPLALAAGVTVATIVGAAGGGAEQTRAFRLRLTNARSTALITPSLLTSAFALYPG